MNSHIILSLQQVIMWKKKQDVFFVAKFLFGYILHWEINSSFHQVLHMQCFTMLSWFLSDMFLLYLMIDQILSLICMVVMVANEESYYAGCGRNSNHLVLVHIVVIPSHLPKSLFAVWLSCRFNMLPSPYNHSNVSDSSSTLAMNLLQFLILVCLGQIRINSCQLSCHGLIGVNSLNCGWYISPNMHDPSRCQRRI